MRGLVQIDTLAPEEINQFDIDENARLRLAEPMRPHRRLIWLWRPLGGLAGLSDDRSCSAVECRCQLAICTKHGSIAALY